MIVLKFMLISVWICTLLLLVAWALFRKILPKYKISTSDVSFQELLLALNAAINTELELWKDDVFVDHKGIATNSQYENYYSEISMTIVNSLSPTYFENMEKYISQQAVVSIIGRRVKNFLNEQVMEPMPDPSIDMMFQQK